MIDEKLKEFFNKFPHIKENKPLQNTLSKKIKNLIKKEIQHGASQFEAEQKALLNLTDLDTMLSQLKSLEENDYVKYNDFFAKIFDSKLVNELKIKLNKTLLFLPKEFTGFLTIRSQSGDVYINKISNYCMVDVTAVSGDFLLAHSTLKRVQADLKSGDIVISNTSANVFHVNGHSGMLDSNDVDAKEEISYHTISGNMELENINTKNFFVDTKSGKIAVNGLTSENIDLVTDTGLMLLNNLTGSGNIKSDMGKINLSLAEKSKFNLSIQSKVGNISVNVPPAIFFKFKINTKKIGPTDFPLDAIIYGNDDYDKIEGYVGKEDSTNLIDISSKVGKVSIKNQN